MRKNPQEDKKCLQISVVLIIINELSYYIENVKICSEG